MAKDSNDDAHVIYGPKKRLSVEQVNPVGIYSGANKRNALYDDGFIPEEARKAIDGGRSRTKRG